MTDIRPFAERIAASEPVHRSDGKRIFLAWPMSISEPKQLVLTYQAAPGRPQLIHVAINGGSFLANGQHTNSFLIRCNRTKGPVTFVAEPEGDVATIYVWNGWTVDGIDQAWLGNSGVCVEADHGDVHDLAFSDGVGAPSFTDLTVSVQVASLDATP